MILHIPHAARAIPPPWRSALQVSDAVLERERIRMTDTDTDALFAPHARPGDQAVVFPVSRLLVDPERFEADAEEPMASRGMGVIYTATHDAGVLRAPPTPTEREALLAAFYRPHHQRLRAAVADYFPQHSQNPVSYIHC